MTRNELLARVMRQARRQGVNPSELFLSRIAECVNVHGITPEVLSTYTGYSTKIISQIAENARPEELPQTEEALLPLHTPDFDLKAAKVYIMKAERAALSGHKFELNFPQFAKLLLAPICAYTGREIDCTTASFERVDPFIGYTPENTVMVHQYVNAAKADLDNFLKNPMMSMADKKKVLELMLERLDFSEKHDRDPENLLGTDEPALKMKAKMKELSADKTLDYKAKMSIIFDLVSIYMKNESNSPAARLEQSRKWHVPGVNPKAFNIFRYNFEAAIAQGTY